MPSVLSGGGDFESKSDKQDSRNYFETIDSTLLILQRTRGN